MYIYMCMQICMCDHSNHKGFFFFLLIFNVFFFFSSKMNMHCFAIRHNFILRKSDGKKSLLHFGGCSLLS